LSGALSIGVGADHACAMLSSTVKCWGRNFFGQLGNGETGDDYWTSAPVEVVGLPAGVVAIAAGARNTCALTGTGAVLCWGDIDVGQLGDGSTLSHAMPELVSGLDQGVVAIAAGREHTCAAMAAGGVKCWGYNSEGQIGDGTAEY